MATLYSKVKILGHPLHPMLVTFPIAFFNATLVAFVVYAVSRDVTWFRIGYWCNVAGLIAGVLAAIPGLLDWAFGVPAGTPAKRVGRHHLLLNTAVLLLFGANALVQSRHLRDPEPSAILALVLSLAGVGALLVSGYLGWTLVQTHHVGVDLSREQRRLEPDAKLRRVP